MTEALSILLILFGLVALLLPRHGIVPRLLALRRTSRRILHEDVLKHIATSEQKRLTASMNSIAGALAVSPDRAAAIIQTLQLEGLVETHGEEIRLTGEGRTYALRIIRTHRLWERYLADETSVGELDWHSRAERKEHFISEEEANALAAKLGFPRYDPHGDPIPTGSGHLPDSIGVQLTTIEPGSIVRVIHIEDEPAAVYVQLVRKGLRAGLVLRMMERSDDKLILLADKRKITLSHVQASALTVRHAHEEDSADAPGYPSLAEVPVGRSCVVTHIHHACRGQQRRRLMDLGILPGTRIDVIMRSPMSDPTAYSIRGATIGLRKQQAEMIFVEPLFEIATQRNHSR